MVVTTVYAILLFVCWRVSGSGRSAALAVLFALALWLNCQKGKKNASQPGSSVTNGVQESYSANQDQYAGQKGEKQPSNPAEGKGKKSGL